MVLRTKPAEICGVHRGPRRQVLVDGAVHVSPHPQMNVLRPAFLALILLGVATTAISARSQQPPVAAPPATPVAVAPASGTPSSIAANPPASSSPTTAPNADNDSLLALDGLSVLSISFEGVSAECLAPLPGHLDQAEGAPLSADNLRKSLRQLYATGLYDSIEVQASRQPGGVALTFVGTPRTFIGTLSVDGAVGPTMNTQLERASQLQAGTRFTQAKMLRAVQQMHSTLEDNGYHEAAITQTVTPHAEHQLADVALRVVSGPRARVGKITVTGDSGMTLDEFRRHANLRAGAHVDHDIVNRALDGVLRQYQKQNRLEADVKLESANYNSATKSVDYSFTANRGPVVKVEVKGAPVGAERIKHLVPIFEEGSVDEDLLNEGNRRLRDFFQRQGYFDVKVDHQSQAPASNQPGPDQSGPNQPGSDRLSSDRVDILYTIQLGTRRRVEKVSVDGNHYFDSATLTALLSVHTAGVLDRHGVYSQALVSADVSAIQSVYQSNGFAHVKVTPETSTPETAAVDNSSPTGPQTAIDHTAPLQVIYHIAEGPQLRVGTLSIEGNEHIATTTLTALLNTAPSQMLSPLNLAGDHDAIVTDYYSRGFDQATVTIAQQTESSDPSKVDVVFHVDEGEQLFVRDVLLTGLMFTRPQTVARAITLHPGDPLNRTALSDTQRNLYDFALFNEVNAAIENPDGGAPQKTILLQTVEARRWTLTPGIGFEAQTGQPQNNCAGATAGGVKCNPNGKTGVSPRVLADITRNGLFGRDQSISLRGTYGLLEQSAGIQYQIPHLQGNPNFGFTFSGGYANSLDVSTYVASRLEAAFRFTQSFNRPGSWLSRANTFVYEIDFRRVKVSASSLQVYPGEISLLSTATRVGGPAFTWIRDTRDLAMDARRGTYTSFQEFLSDRFFGAEAEFNRIDTSNSSYYSFDKGRYVVARNTRYGQIRAFGSGANGIIPLPERLYAGGAVSLRGFSQNAAGPRDPETGFQIGGAGALTNSTELRLPPPTLPGLGNTVSFVIFHDMGNVFTNAGDAWASALRVRQPNSAACRNAVVTNPSAYPTGYTPTGLNTSTGQQGVCSFNDFSHALGLGLRYHTPVGPIRFDVSYNLNPPIYPVNINYSIPTATGSLIPGFATGPYLGQSPHINFFFSLGQAF
jgi:outer membrane protein insertion porin family